MNKYAFIFCLVLVVVFPSCEKELQKYDGKPVIYFNEAARLPAYEAEVLNDSSVVSFSLSKVQDSIVSMVVASSGAKQSTDRRYAILATSSSGAVEGLHYEILNTDFTIRKNQILDTIYIKFFRTEDMRTKSIDLVFDLLDNENFSTLVKGVEASVATKERSFIKYKWVVNDMLVRPALWLDSYLGVFSRKKLLLMAEILNIEPSYLDKAVSLQERVAYGKFMQRYLNEQKATGNIILEDDGSEMKMGSASQ